MNLSILAWLDWTSRALDLIDAKAKPRLLAQFVLRKHHFFIMNLTHETVFLK